MTDSTLVSNVSYNSNSKLCRNMNAICTNYNKPHQDDAQNQLDTSDEESSIASLTLTQTYDINDSSMEVLKSSFHMCKEPGSIDSLFIEKCRREYSQLYETLMRLAHEYLYLLNNGIANRKYLDIKSILPVNLMLSYQKYSANFVSIKNLKFLQYKIWKNHYCMLLDAVDVLFKDLHYIKKQRNAQVIESEVYKLVEEIRSRFGHSLIRCSRTNAACNSIDISCAFLIDLINQCRVYRGELERQDSVKERLFYILKTAKDQRAKLKMYVSNLRNDLNLLLMKTRNYYTLKSSTLSEVRISSLSSQSSEVTPQEKEMYEQKIQDLERILKEEEMRRKKLHNRLQELIGNIRVYCRIRPYYKSFMKVAGDDKLVVLADKLSAKITHKWYGQKSKCFIFDHVFKSESSQTDVFSYVEELITSCVDGYNVCIMAYGQTGSGKTHTMMGTVDDPGVNRRAVQRLLEICRARKNQWRYRLFVSMVEVYQEEVKDLLHDEFGGHVKIMSGADDEVNLQGLSEHEVSIAEDVLQLFSIGERNRTVGATLLNEASSRSHLAVLIRVCGVNSVIGGRRSMGTLTLCDLAGAESVSKSGATGERFCEASRINRSLTALGRVFDALRRRQKPAYRESKLTYLLKPTLGGDAKCLLIINLRGEPEHAEESLRAIHFGCGAMQVAPEKAQYKAKIRKTIGTFG